MSKRVAKALKKHGRNLGNWVTPTERKRNLTRQRANSFVVGVLFDQQVNADQAWAAAEWITESIGDEDNDFWAVVCKMDSRRLIGFMRYGWAGYAFHRHPKKMANYLKGCAKIITKEYKGDPRRIWRNTRNISKVRDRLEELPGIGPALSRMAVLILVRRYGMFGSGKVLAQLDVKPDVHLKRVFNRAGLVSGNPSFNDYLAAAKNLSPSFPAELDAPAWDIGRKYCYPKEPNCRSCPLDKCCPKIDIAI